MRKSLRLKESDIHLVLTALGSVPDDATEVAIAVEFPDGNRLEIDDEHPLVVSWTY